MKLQITDKALCNMSAEMVEKLKLYQPKKVLLVLDTSGSPSCWTDNGEIEITSPEPVYEAAKMILEEVQRCYYHNINSSGDNYWNCNGIITIIF